MGYKHLTREQRYTIEALLQTSMSLREIAEVIGVSKGTVSREIRRNCDMRGHHRYRWQLAQKKYERRMKTRKHFLKFTDEMKRIVRRFIVYGQYSPEQICGRFRMKGEEMVCAETIYRWVWQEKRRGNDEMARNLRHGGRRRPRRDRQYSSRGMIQDRVDISLRPDVVNEKKRFGDFEIDTIIGKNRKGAIMTTNDRCTHLVLIRRLEGKEAVPLADAAIEALLPYKDKIHTITADNGKEFARHKEIAKGLDAEFYFARPYHSWERGANENTNGLIRQYIPKGTDFSELTDEMIAEIEWKLNNRPRKSLGYLTPIEYCKLMFNFEFGVRCTSE
jgi:Transposase and inactivated derivatives, IS30 family